MLHNFCHTVSLDKPLLLIECTIVESGDEDSGKFAQVISIVASLGQVI